MSWKIQIQVIWGLQFLGTLAWGIMFQLLSVHEMGPMSVSC